MNLRLKLIRFQLFVRKHILHTSDSPHKIALGVAIGLFVAWTPALGLHIFLAVSLAAIFRVNKFAAFVSAWASNPFTLIPIYYPNFLVGKKILSFFQSSDPGFEISEKELVGRLTISDFENIFVLDFWKKVFRIFWDLGLPELWVGSLVIGIFVAVIGYIISYKFIEHHRLKTSAKD